MIISTDPRGRNSELLRGLNRVGEEFVRRAGPQLRRDMAQFIRTARALVPTDKGNLRRSIFVRSFRSNVVQGVITGINIDNLASVRGTNIDNAIRGAKAAEFGRRRRRGRGSKAVRGIPYFERTWRNYYQRRVTNRARRRWRLLIADIQSGKLDLRRLSGRGRRLARR